MKLSNDKKITCNKYFDFLKYALIHLVGSYSIFHQSSSLLHSFFIMKK